MIQTDVLIIGAGIIGASIAREFSKYHGRVIVLDKNNESCQETSKANSGIVHAGYDPVPGSQKAILNVKGARLYRELHEELAIPYEEIGSLVLARTEEDKLVLNQLFLNGLANGLTDLQMLDQDQVRQLEPQVADSVVSALYAPSAAIICPFNATFAFMDNAIQNGAHFYPRQAVISLKKEGGQFVIETPNETYYSRILINAAGVSTGDLARLLGDEVKATHVRRGEYRVLDLSERIHYRHVLFQVPTALGKGILVTPTVHGNVLLGPTSTAQESRQDTSVTTGGLDQVDQQIQRLVKRADLSKTIRLFSGLRNTGDDGDFDIHVGASGAIHLNAIDSPGLASAPAIAEYVVELAKEAHELIAKTDFLRERPGIKLFKDHTFSDQMELMRQNPDYGDIVCRCEEITKADILSAIDAGAVTIGGIKRRVRPGSGRCQGGFCEHRILRILAKAKGVSLDEIEKERPGSWMVKR